MKKCVLVTGSSRGLGKSIIKLFASNGYDVIINYNISKNEAECLKKEVEELYKVNAYVYKCDVSKEIEVKELFAKIKKEIGNIDVIVNNAGISKDNVIEDKSGTEFTDVIGVNLLGTYLVCKYAKKVMDKGSIINISSNQSFKPSYVESIDYDASKAGVNSLTHSLALYYAPSIRVNAVAPGWINTDMNKDISESFKVEEESKILLNRFAECDEIANVIYFLASDDASYINDTIIKVDGGIK